MLGGWPGSTFSTDDFSATPAAVPIPSVKPPAIAPYLPQFENPAKAAGTIVDPLKTGSTSTNPFEMNFDTANLAITGLSSLANIWQAWEANKLAKDQLSFQKEAYAKNLANSMQAYNTKLEDRQGARAAYTGASDADTQAYIEKNRLRS